MGGYGPKLCQHSSNATLLITLWRGYNRNQTSNVDSSVNYRTLEVAAGVIEVYGLKKDPIETTLMRPLQLVIDFNSVRFSDLKRSQSNRNMLHVHISPYRARNQLAFRPMFSANLHFKVSHTRAYSFFFWGKWLAMAKDFGVPRFFITFSITFAALEYNVAILNCSIIFFRKTTDQKISKAQIDWQSSVPNSEEGATTSSARLHTEKILR